MGHALGDDDRGHPHPLAPHGGLQRDVAAGHRPRRHRDADGRRARAARDARRRAGTTSAARSSSSASGSGGGAAATASSSSSSGSAARSTGSARSSPWIRRYSAAVREAFVRLHEEGLIYRARAAHQLVPALPDGAVAISRSTTTRGRRASSTSSPIRWPTARARWWSRRRAPRRCSATPRSPSTPTIRATRRRSASCVRHPFVNRRVPDHRRRRSWSIPKFGTGAVKVTPAHDPNDFETGQRHNLPMISDPRRDGDGQRRGRGRSRGSTASPRARRSRRELEELGLERGSKPHVHAVGHCQRCETVVEPMLSTQWFVKMEPLAKPAIEAVEQGKTKFVPESWTKTYFHWMNNIRDWCISRQLWWGHRIPAWYCGKCGEMTVARTDARRLRQVRAATDAQAGRGRARHLVLVRALAVLDARLARRDARAQDVLPDDDARHRLRHPLLLGRPHDDGGPPLHEEGAVPDRLPAHDGHRRERREDVEGEGQRHRSPSTSSTSTAPTRSASRSPG